MVPVKAVSSELDSQNHDKDSIDLARVGKQQVLTLSFEREHKYEVLVDVLL